MSKLIRDPETAGELSAAGIDDVTSLRLLKGCQALAVDQVREGFRQTLQRFESLLQHETERAVSNQEAAFFQELQRQLQQKQEDLERYFCGYVAEGFVKFRKRQLHTETAQGASSPTELTLVDHEELEETIAISSITQRADVYYAEPLWALNRRLSVLNRAKVTEASNPAAPVQLCESWRRAIRLMPLNARARALIYRVYDEQMFRCAGALIHASNEYLREQGILPGLQYRHPSGKASPTYVSPRARAAEVKEAPAAGAGQLVQAIRHLQSRLSGEVAEAAASAGLTGSPGIDHSVEQVVQALASVQGQALNPNADAMQSASVDVSALLVALTGQVQQDGGSMDRSHAQTIDLVGMLFEYMLKDENLPSAVKAQLSYLHTPFLKLAFVDPGFFEQPQHPARLLLNSLAEAGARWVQNDGSSQFGIYEKIKQTVDRVLRDFDNDVRVIAELLLEFSSHTKQILRRQELMEKRATEKAEGEEKLRVVKQRVNEEVRQRIKKRELPSAVLLLLLQPWSDYLSFTLLRYGESADRWHDALAVVDGILWSIEPRQLDAERQRQRELRHSILETLEAGFETIGYDLNKARKLTETIGDLIDQALQRQPLVPAPEPVRTELERLAAERAGDDPVDASPLTPEEARMVDNLKMIEFGTWLEFDGHQRLKVAWYNQRTSHYMLVDQMGKKAAMMSGAVMARALLAGQARVISGSSKPIFDRALETIYQKLNARAEALDQQDS